MAAKQSRFPGPAPPVPAEMRKVFQNARRDFKELSLEELGTHEDTFNRFNHNRTGYMDMMELKGLMEAIKQPQTHLELNRMVKEIDIDNDQKISYPEYLLIFRYARTGKLQSAGLKALASFVSVKDVGVKGAKGFFEEKAAALNDDVAARDRAFHEKKKAEAEAARARKNAFKDKAALFQ
mmetsp:Transcript_30475/g.76506  ORF Transcript_30475/g.76506 Transcript_30475/m.76506 type:complete len:180 (-) Transcript_30475:80-619(-)|eukprot:CAMPEP_0177667908 /NCGR_PEP_ID=MMETSP0447-20121125/22406_1 /TAXON_ID=0 /ORGANISM="Stygamoeba regulata, Strain BSH-02190019" /LENGTH=179 /DNA_ID=CAMNT_0019174235 /DNA_START=35 /DNA_END=574 /DNA_ORIENTATION=+